MLNEQENRQEELELKQVTGKAQHIEINERTLQAYKEEFAKKGLVITKKSEYPREDFYLIKTQKKFDSIVDPTKGIRKIIESMVRQPVTIFNKQGKVEVKERSLLQRTI